MMMKQSKLLRKNSQALSILILSLEIKMSKSKTNAYEYVQLQESTDTSFVQVFQIQKIVVTFAGNMHYGFERKSSLLTLQEDELILIFYI